jgi:pyroglutamyl-peptidase
MAEQGKPSPLPSGEARQAGDTVVEVVVTGFGPFPGQPVNPTEALVTDLLDDPTIAGTVLPVSWTRAADIAEQLADDHPEAAVVAFGVAADAEAVRIEQWAHNLDDSDRPDADGDTRSGTPIIEAAPDRLGTRLPVQELVEALQDAGIPVEVSSDAGRYVCNHLMYDLLDRVELDRVVGFVHVPDLGAFTEDQLRQAIHVIVEVLRDHAQ